MAAAKNRRVWVTLSSKIPEDVADKFVEQVEKTGGRKSRVICSLIEEYLKDTEAPLYTCDRCRKPIPDGELYYSKCLNRERSGFEYLEKERKNRRYVQPVDSVTLEIYCEPCAKKHRLDKFITARQQMNHKSRDEGVQVMELERAM